MAAALDIQKLNLVFQTRPDILAGIHRVADNPASISLFNDIASFVYDQLAHSAEPAAKRRRIDVDQTNGQPPPHPPPTAQASNGAAPVSTLGGPVSTEAAAAADPVLLEIKDISVSVPQRKKYDLCFTKDFLYARASGSTAPVPGVIYPWRDIEYLFYVPVPEKSQVQHNHVLFPRGTSLPSRSPDASDAEPLVFTVSSSAPPKPGSIAGPSADAARSVSDTYSALLHWALTTSLRAAGNHDATLVAADPRVFHSVARQPFRPAEKAVHVKAFRGSKDGYLFFLPTGILWGFKKPLLFLPLDRVVAVSYTSVLQRTFNVVVEVDAGGGGPPEEVEFAMLDQEDYAAIDETYVRRHGLQDRSMAEQRRAKRELAENARDGKTKAGAAEGADAAAAGAQESDAADGMTELERAHLEAEQRLQDEEDENEEDYDPGSAGESEGEGETSDEEEEQGEGEEGEEEEEEEEYDEEEGGGRGQEQDDYPVEDYSRRDDEDDGDESFDVVG